MFEFYLFNGGWWYKLPKYPENPTIEQLKFYDEFFDMSDANIIHRYLKNPHNKVANEEILNNKIKETSTPDEIIASFFDYLTHYSKLLPIRKQDMLKELTRNDILVNKSGGWCRFFGDDHYDMKICSDKFIYPDDAENFEITISRYPNCKHYYLTSKNNNRLFLKNRFNTLTSAKKYAKKLTDNVIISELCEGV